MKKSLFRICAPFLILMLLFVTNCSSVQRSGTEVSDQRWSLLQDVVETFNDIKSQIDRGETVTIEDLNNWGFGPGTPNVKEVGYLELEKMLIGEKGDRARLPNDIFNCTEKKDACYGLVITVLSLTTQGKESLFKRMFTGEKKTEKTGWKFGAVFAILKDVSADLKEKVVAAYLREKDGNVAMETKENDPFGAIMGGLRPLSLIPGL